MGEEDALRAWLGGESAYRLAEARRDTNLALKRLEELGARVVSLADPDYPAGLKDLPDPPPFLTVLGRLPQCGGTAIVGSRDAEPSAMDFARRLASCAGGPIVSGLARGVDAAAHEGALASNAPTIAYVGNGLGATYPPEHRDLEDRIVAAGGAILSERLPDEPVAKWALAKRDRLQAAHADAVVLVQSDPTGGAMHTMRFARELGRKRFALEPPRNSNVAYAGNAHVLAEGAAVLPWDADEACRLISNSTKTSRA